MRTPILVYHWFHEPRAPRGVSPEFGMRPDDFVAQLDWLRETGRNVVDLAAIVRGLEAAPGPPKGSIAITFDDAYEDFREHALEPLRARSFPSTLFVVSGLVGRLNEWDQRQGEPPRRLLGWEGLREVAQAGVEIGAHSVSHPDLRTLSDVELRDQCLRSRLTLEDKLGQPVRHFAYPFGYYDTRVKHAAREAGYAAACAVLLRPWDLLRSDRFALMRVIIHATKGLWSFRLRSRLAAPLHRAA